MGAEIGQRLVGHVASLTKFGAFVQLETKQIGLVHISEISNTFINDIQDVLSVGDEVDVVVTNITKDDKISLSIKQAVKELEQEGIELPQKEKKETIKKDNVRELPTFGNRKKVNETFDDLVNTFLRDSGERLASLRRNTDSKRGGRGGRRGQK